MDNLADEMRVYGGRADFHGSGFYNVLPQLAQYNTNNGIGDFYP